MQINKNRRRNYNKSTFIRCYLTFKLTVTIAFYLNSNVDYSNFELFINYNDFSAGLYYESDNCFK